MAGIVEREILLSRDFVARAAAALAPEPEQRWMLCQPREVRRSYVSRVLDAPNVEAAQQAWMLSRPDVVRESYINSVLRAPGNTAPPEAVWMLRQPESVRRSYVAEVLRVSW
jgi:hypothetical protein